MRRITYKKGKIVHLGEKPHILNLIHKKFGNEKFVKSQILEFLERDLGYNSASKHLSVLKSYGWLNSKKIGKGTSKDSRNYYLSKKARKYLERWGRFIYGPLVKEKEPEKVFVDREVQKETKKSKEEDVVGFV